MFDIDSFFTHAPDRSVDTEFDDLDVFRRDFNDRSTDQRDIADIH